tara:strand:- start:1023 stop:2597 length:1575 start_codon:yes stop_codon:yes gene_type:complete
MTPERLDELIQKYVLGIQTESEMGELSGHLSQDDSAEARRKLRLALKVDAYLEEAAAEMGRETGLSENAASGAGNSLKHRFWTMGGIAAAVAVGLFGWFHDAGTSRRNSELGVATVLRIHGEGFAESELANGERSLSRGDTLLAGDQLTMSEGLVELVFRHSGVHAIATAPLSLSAYSSEKIFLHNGEVKLHVPPQGVGFVVETAEREITDLGTSFVVTARDKGSQVFVLDGQISLDNRNGVRGRLMTEGEIASFGKNGRLNLLSKKTNGLPELAQDSTPPSVHSLQGMILGLEVSAEGAERRPGVDLMGQRIAPLIQSGFQNRDCLEGLRQGQSLRFPGIAGAYNQFAERTQLEPYAVNGGWLSWYQGKATAPRPGRYRFWGYADNNLLVAIDGKSIFDGSRYDSALHTISNVKRRNHPAWPCLNASAGFASGPWVEINQGPVQLDILFGEVSGNLTSGLLLVEREGESYEETFWGQPKWSLFLTEEPDAERREELDRLRDHMEKNLMGSFSVSDSAVWKVGN